MDDIICKCDQVSIGEQAPELKPETVITVEGMGWMTHNVSSAQLPKSGTCSGDHRYQSNTQTQ